MPPRIRKFPADAVKESILIKKVLDGTQNFRQSQDEDYRNFTSVGNPPTGYVRAHTPPDVSSLPRREFETTSLGVAK
jgi:hypothetical protein